MTYNLKEPKNSVGDKISPARSYQISSPHLVGENGNNCSQRHLYVREDYVKNLEFLQ